MRTLRDCCFVSIGGCLGAILVSAAGVAWLYAVGAEKDGQAGMIFMLTIPVGIGLGAGLVAILSERKRGIRDSRRESRGGEGEDDR